MWEGIKNGLLRLERESKNQTIIYKEDLSHGRQVWMDALCDVTPGHSLKDTFGSHSVESWITGGITVTYNNVCENTAWLKNQQYPFK